MAAEVLVTGASGFVGEALCRRLRALGRIRALGRHAQNGPWDDFVACDLAADRSDDALVRALDGVDVVFHLAAKAHDVEERSGADSAHRRVTVDGTRRLLEACRAAGVGRLVYVSSVKAMGEGGAERVDESFAARPTTEYGRCKREAEDLVLRGGYVAHATVLRLPMVYGPGHKGNLARMIEAVDRGRFPPPPRVKNRRSMIHVDDVALAAVLASGCAAASGRVFIVTDGREYSTREMYEWMCACLGKDIPAWSVPLPLLWALALLGDAIGGVRGKRWRFDSAAYEKLFGSAVYDASAARDVLGFQPAWDLARALPDMVEAYRRDRATTASKEPRSTRSA
jgi:UDP-glucose 4-epimerase